MWTTVLLVFLSLIFSSNGQGVTNFDIKTVTDSTQSNQGIKWDTAGPPVTLSIRDGRSNSVNSPRSESANDRLFYSNEWQPYLMSVGSGYGNRQLENVGDDNVNYQFIPTLLRRSESEMNRTSSRQMNLNPGFETPLPPVPIPTAPNPSTFYYPPPSSSAILNENTYTTSDSNTLNNSSMPTAKPFLPESDVQRDSISSPDFGLLPEDFERYPFHFYRTGNFFMPHPAFGSPYSILSSGNENNLPPPVYPYAASPIYERETGADARDTNIVRQSAPETVKPAALGDIQERSEGVNGTPSDASSTFVPPEPFRLSLGSYPFGILPPPILPNVFPNSPPTANIFPNLPPTANVFPNPPPTANIFPNLLPTANVFPNPPPIQPLLNGVNFQKEGIIADAVAAQSPIPTNIPLEPVPGGLPPPNTLLPSAELPAAVDANLAGVPLEEPASPARIPYEFGYDMNDGKGTDQHRKEVSDLSGTVRGSYGYRDMFGVYRIVNYIADKNGFRAVIKSNEPGVASSGSANVVVMAEQPPPQAIAEGQKPDAIIVPDVATDLIAEGSATAAK